MRSNERTPCLLWLRHPDGVCDQAATRRNAGKSFVIRSGPQFELLAVNDLGDANHPSPAVAAGRMFLVGMKNVYCVRKH